MEHSMVITRNHRGLVSGTSLLVLLLVATLASPQQARAGSEDAALAVILGAGLLYAARDHYRDERGHRKHKRRDHHDNAYRYNGHRDHGYRYGGRHDNNYRHGGPQRHRDDSYYDRGHGHKGKSHGKHAAKYDRHARFDRGSEHRGGNKHRDSKPAKHDARDHSRHQPVWEGSTRVRMYR